MWRTFTDAVPKARKGQLDRFFLQKRYFICILSSKILKTGPKADKNTLKTVHFPTPLTNWLSLARFVAQHFRPRLKRCATNQAKLSQMVRGVGKNSVLRVFLSAFGPVFRIFNDNMHMKCLFCKKNRSN